MRATAAVATTAQPANIPAKIATTDWLSAPREQTKPSQTKRIELKQLIL